VGLLALAPAFAHRRRLRPPHRGSIVSIGYVDVAASAYEPVRAYERLILKTAASFRRRRSASDEPRRWCG